MWRFLGIIFLILGFCVAGYVVFVFAGYNYGTWKLSLIGPGKTPAQCMVRAKPIFDRMKPQLDLAAQRLLNNSSYDQIRYVYDEGLIFEKAQGEFKTLNQIEVAITEKEFFEEIFYSFRGEKNTGGYYTPYRIGRVETSSGQRFIYVTNGYSECGYSAGEWIIKRMNLSTETTYSSRPVPVRATIGFIYDENGWPDLQKCPFEELQKKRRMACGEKMSDKWLMETKWVILPPSHITPEEWFGFEPI